MLQLVDVGRQSIDSYRRSSGDEILNEVRDLARSLRGLRVLHVNATPYGGGVAEMLRSKIPLLRDVGIDADWRLIVGDETFFSVTKDIHNGLQGSKRALSGPEKETFLAYSHRNAKLLEDEPDYDIVVVHDPQPMAIPALHHSEQTRWIWRCHVDTSEPNPEVWEFIKPFLDTYDSAVFTLTDFVPKDFPIKDVDIIPPAIDPESPKNIELPGHLARQLLSWIGVSMHEPLITQVSRFDRWKDPLGVIAVYRLVAKEVPNLQLVLAGSMASDDPEGWEMYRQIQEDAAGDPAIHVFTNLTGVSNVEINALQRVSDLVIQKSIREGFGLVVSETLWKSTPVVAGRAGGIPLQLKGGGGYLVGSVEECAERTIELLADPELRQEMGRHGRREVRSHFLLPRLIADELRLYASILGDGSRRSNPAGQEGGSV